MVEERDSGGNLKLLLDLLNGSKHVRKLAEELEEQGPEPDASG